MDGSNIGDIQVEDIDDADEVSRQLFEPSMRDSNGQYTWQNIFMFKTENKFAESVVWRRHAPLIEDVHALGCVKQKNDRDEGKKSTYIGAMTGIVKKVREIRTANGAKFIVIHDPSGGQGIQHAHIQYDMTEKPLTKNDKAELKKKICELFSINFDDHQCVGRAA